MIYFYVVLVTCETAWALRAREYEWWNTGKHKSAEMQMGDKRVKAQSLIKDAG